MTPAGWDDRWLPEAAARVQRLVARATEAVARLAGPGSLLGDAARGEPALAGSIAAVAAAAAILAIAGGPGGPPGEGGGSSASPPPFPSPVTAMLGPAPGASVADYLARARDGLDRFAGSAGGRSGVAVVDLRTYLTPAAAARAVSGVQVLRAYVRAPATGLPTQVHAVPLPGTFASVEAGIEASGRLAVATAHTFQVLVAQMHPRTPQDQKLRERYALQQRASAYEAERLQRPRTCACVFALAVEGDAAALTRLARSPSVRVVDVATPGVRLDAVTILPLEPEVTTVVPRGGLLGG